MATKIIDIAGMSAKNLRDAIADKTFTRPQVRDALKLRFDNMVANKRVLKQPSLKLYAELAGVEYEYDRGALMTRKQRAAQSAPVEAEEAPAKPKAKRTRNAKAKPAKQVTVEELVAQLGEATSHADAETQLAAFTTLVEALVAKL